MSSPEAPTLTAAPSSAIICTFVHGTFSSHRLWTGAGAGLVQALQERFGSSLQVRTFRWNGWNGQRSRMKAAARLREDLWKAIREHPEATHVVITHSHGGNVALYALKDPDLRAGISGIVTLATPFIVPKGRRIQWLLVASSCGLGAQIGLPIVLYALGVLFTGSFFLDSSSSSEGENFLLIVCRIVVSLRFVYLGAQIGGLLSLALIELGRKWIRSQQRRAIRCYPRLVYPGLRVLNIQVARDEARGLLRAFTLLAETPLNALFHPVVIGIMLCVSFTLEMMFIDGVNAGKSVSPWIALIQLTMMITAGWFGVLLVIALLAPLVTVAHTLLRGHFAGFGLERFAINMVMRIRSAPRPVIRGAQVTHVTCPFDERGLPSRLRLRHSWPYMAPEVMSVVKHFIVGLQSEPPAPRNSLLPSGTVQPMRQSASAIFGWSWFERVLASLALILLTPFFVWPTWVDLAWQGDESILRNHVVLSAFASSAKNGDVVAVDFTDLTETYQEFNKLSHWQRATRPWPPFLGYVYMRVIASPGKVIRSSTWSSDDYWPPDAPGELFQICQQQADRLRSQVGMPVPVGYVEVQALSRSANGCTAVMPMEYVTGVLGKFPAWRVWALTTIL